MCVNEKCACFKILNLDLKVLGLSVFFMLLLLHFFFQCFHACLYESGPKENAVVGNSIRRLGKRGGAPESVNLESESRRHLQVSVAHSGTTTVDETYSEI